MVTDTIDKKKRKRKRDVTNEDLEDGNMQITKMIKQSSHQIITAGRDTKLAISAKKKKSRAIESESRKLDNITKNLRRSSIFKNSQNTGTSLKDAKLLVHSKAGSSMLANTSNTGATYVVKNEITPNTSTNVNDTNSNSLKTLETYIETMGIDVPSKRHLLAYNKVSKVIIYDKSAIILLYIKIYMLSKSYLMC